MFGYIARRALTSIPLLLGITLLCFAVMHLAPGDPTLLMGDFNPKAQANEAMKENYGLNKPIHEQYVHWLTNLATLELGASMAPGNMPVVDKIADALPVTLWLNVVGMVLILMMSIPLGIIMARNPGNATDTGLTLFLYLGLAAPGFWLALLGMQLFGLQLGWLPLSGLQTFGAEHWPWHQRYADLAWHLTLPILVGLVGGAAGLSRFVRGSLIDAMQADYILTARAKGAKESRVWTHHGLRNALLPVITILGLSVPGLIGGSVILESLFAIPGLGQLFYTAVMMRDYPVIMALLTGGAVLTLLGNLLADIAYAYADPRVRLS